MLSGLSHMAMLATLVAHQPPEIFSQLKVNIHATFPVNDLLRWLIQLSSVTTNARARFIRSMFKVAKELCFVKASFRRERIRTRGTGMTA